ncbi:predicted protein [Lichtheimia corymbifera JMRC:FSU:9682]|uniref:Uncharacterized protein n=1 Tax=Lichtheimia corymbifera JMRC:FSU:9682 TaxID=1263082 RepID=A0A068SBB1_9FUNG|nr:predicted protein [Lichtheimia corymbifera JMRC:FSU:9682]
MRERAILDHRFHTIDCSEEADITPRIWDFVEELFDEPAMDARSTTDAIARLHQSLLGKRRICWFGSLRTNTRVAATTVMSGIHA